MANFLLILLFTIWGGRIDNTKLSPASPEFPFLKAGNEWHFQMKTSQTPTPMEVVYKILSIRDDGYIEVENSFPGMFSDKIYWYADKNEFSEIASPDDNYKKYALRWARDIRDLKKVTEGEQPITYYQEYICPGCGTLLQVDTWCPLIDDDEPVWDVAIRL